MRFQSLIAHLENISKGKYDGHCNIIPFKSFTKELEYPILIRIRLDNHIIYKNTIKLMISTLIVIFKFCTCRT